MSPNEEHSESCIKHKKKSKKIVLNKQVFGLIRQVIFWNAKCISDIWTTLKFLFTEDFVQDLVKLCFPYFTYLELLPFVKITQIAQFKLSSLYCHVNVNCSIIVCISSFLWSVWRKLGLVICHLSELCLFKKSLKSGKMLRVANFSNYTYLFRNHKELRF